MQLIADDLCQNFEHRVDEQIDGGIRDVAAAGFTQHEFAVLLGDAVEVESAADQTLPQPEKFENSFAVGHPGAGRDPAILKFRQGQREITGSPATISPT